MNLPSKYLDRAVEQLASLPGIGKRTTLRLVLNLLNRSEEELKQFTDAFTEMKAHICKCEICGNISDQEICSICANDKRDTSTICVVEDIRDILAFEATSSYKGVYHVLGGVISPMDGISPSDLNITSLLERADHPDVHEIIFALSPTMEGDTTNYYLFKKLKEKQLVITSLSRGVAIGTELQYADEMTLSRSLQQRQPFTV